MSCRLAAVAIVLLPCAALADGAVSVALPDLGPLDQSQAEKLLAASVNAVIFGQNCPGEYQISDGEWALLNGTADVIAYEILGLSVESYDAIYWSPVFDRLDQPGACAAEAPLIPGLVAQFVARGGTTGPTK